MQTRSVNDLTIRELINQSELICRDLADHLKQNFIPRTESLVGLIHPGSSARPETDSKTVHQHLRLIDDSIQFSRKTLDRFESLVEAIDQSTTRIISPH